MVHNGAAKENSFIKENEIIQRKLKIQSGDK